MKKKEMKEVKIYLPEYLLNEIDIQAEKVNISRSAYIRNYLEDSHYAYKNDVLQLVSKLIAIESEIEQLNESVRDALYIKSNHVWSHIKEVI